MYEFHGWAVLRHNSNNINAELQQFAIKKFLLYLKENFKDEIFNQSSFINHNCLNGQDTFTISGLNNHFRKYPLDSFNWISENLPGSYGLLYIWNDEGVTNENNKFMVWKLTKGVLTKEEDYLLSPCIPVIEDEYDSNQNN